MRQRDSLIKILQAADHAMKKKEIATQYFGRENNGSGITIQLERLCEDGLVIKTGNNPAFYSWKRKDSFIQENRNDTNKSILPTHTSYLKDFTKKTSIIHEDEMSTRIFFDPKAWTSEEIICFSTLPLDVRDTINSIINSHETITRNDIFSELDLKKKYIMVLMWGYPKAKTWTGKGERNNMTHILRNAQTGISEITSINSKDLTEIEFSNRTRLLKSIRGLGVSTISKLLYFFNVSIDGNKCIIFDGRVKQALSKYYEVHELSTINQSSFSEYPLFVTGIGKISIEINIPSEVIEFILFESSTERNMERIRAKYV